MCTYLFINCNNTDEINTRIQSRNNLKWKA